MCHENEKRQAGMRATKARACWPEEEGVDFDEEMG